MSTRLKIHKVNTLPGVLEEDALYITRDSYGSLVFSVTDKNGTVAFSSPDTNAIYQLVDDKLSDSPIINGPRNLSLGQVATYTIMNYNASNVYDLTTVTGDVSIEGDTITYRAPMSGRDAGFFIDTTFVSIALSNPSFVDKPSIISPANGASEIPRDFEITCSSFSSTGEVDTHLSSSWQIATDELFNNIYLMTNDNVNAKLAYMADLLPVNTQLYVRVRHKGVNLGYSDWSNTVAFTTKATYIQKPSFTNPTVNETGVSADITATLSAFVKQAGDGTHASTDWVVATDSNFSNIVAGSTDDTVNLLSFDVTGLAVNTSFYIKARFKATTGSYSDWTDTVHFTTKNTYDEQPVTPTISSPVDNDTELGPTLTILASDFTVLSGVETHESTDWQVARDTEFTDLVYQSLNNTDNKVTINLVNLPANSNLHIRVRYKGATIGLSAWSPVTDIATKQSYSSAPDTPSITSPLNNAAGLLANTAFTASAFAVNSGVDTHLSSDWEIATDDAFTNIIISSIDDSLHKIAWTPSNLPVNSTLYVRVRYKGSYTGMSAWSSTIAITTKNTYDTKPGKPSITAPSDNASNLGPDVLIEATAFSISTGTEAHEGSDWQVATDAAFTEIVFQSIDDPVNKLSINATNLPPNDTYYLRARYKGATIGYSDYSDTITISSKQSYSTAPNTPSITAPANNATGLLANAAISASAFAVDSGVDTHEFTDWQVATDVDFTTVIKSSSSDAVNKTSWTPGNLPVDTVLYARVRYKGNYTGLSSWSTVISFSTKNTYDIQPVKPSITSPDNAATDLGPAVTVTTSAFAVNTGTETHQSTDWQVATDAGFTSILEQHLNETTYKTNINLTGLPVNTTLYVRARHKGATIGLSAWSDTVSFSTKQSYSNSPNTPSVTSPANDALNILAGNTFTSSAFAVGSGTDTHQSSDWQIATDAGFTNIIASVAADTGNKTSWTPGNLPVNTSLYVRVRYTGSYTGVSNWSSVIHFTTKNTYDAAPVTPSITAPANNATNQGPNVSFTGSSFTVNTGVEDHQSSDWQIASDAGFTAIVAQSTDDAVNKTAITFNSLPVNTTLYARVRYKGATIGNSNWSSTITLTTKQSYSASPNTPSITAPANNATGQLANTAFTSSAFAVSSGVDTHVSSDWQIATDVGFTNIIASVAADTGNKTTWTPGGLPANTVLYARVRYNGSYTGVSAWSSTIAITTKNTYDSAPVTPSITAPANNATNQGPNVSFTGSSFTVNTGSETHLSTDWEVATDAGFTSIVKSSYNDTVNKTTWTANSLAVNTTFYARVRYKGATIGLSAWSSTIIFTTKQSYSSAPNTPSITTPTNNATNIGAQLAFASSAFGVASGVDTHQNTDWEVATDAGFTSIVKSSYNDTVNKTTWTPGNLPVNTTLYTRVRYRGVYTGVSAWSSVNTFTTKATYVAQPTISSPAASATNQNNSLTVTASAFSDEYTGDTHLNTDWQLSTDSGFSTIISQSLADAVNKTSWPISNLVENTTYYLRTRQRSSSNDVSAWSPSNRSFSTWAKYLNQPSITAPSNGATNQGPYVAFTSSAFSSNLAGETHASSDWQVATNAGFSTIVASVTNDTTNKTSWTISAGLISNTTYYARVRYKSANGFYTNWSTTIIFNTSTSYITTPSITSPTNGATNQGPNVTFTSSAFASSVTGETHTSSDWQLATDAGFTNIFASATNDAVNKTSWTVNNLTANTTYYARVRYKGSSSL